MGIFGQYTRSNNKIKMILTIVYLSFPRYSDGGTLETMGAIGSMHEQE